MPYPILQYSKTRVDKAGKTLLKYISTPEKKWGVDEKEAVKVVNNFRACHAYPINTFQATLRKKISLLTTNYLVAQRLKRLVSTVLKLGRLEKMRLSQMQDIGGLRAVLPSLKMVRKLEKDYLATKFQHNLYLSRDYIKNPKSSGYRGIHLVYKYKNLLNPKYDGLFIELQIRTRMQHIWATAVETMGTYVKYSLKSSEGPQNWLDFFSISGSAFAHMEGTPPVPEYKDLTKKETYEKVLEEENELDLINKLMTFNIATKRVSIDSKKGTYHLIILNYDKKSVEIKTYKKDELKEANREYASVEKQVTKDKPIEVVLVSAGSIKNLKKAYPNYFLDTADFIKQLNGIKLLLTNQSSGRKTATD